MSCPHITDSIADHFEEFLSPVAREKHQQHLRECEECRQEITALDAVSELLNSWHREDVPDWKRSSIMLPHTARKPLPRRRFRWPSIARWAPLAASMVLLLAVVSQARLEVADSGWSLSFGGDTQPLNSIQLNSYLAEYAEAQREENRQWVEATLRTHGETTADSVYQWMTWMEQQRERDVQRVEAGFQQLLDRNFQTVDSVRQLASYVIYQENP